MFVEVAPRLSFGPWYHLCLRIVNILQIVIYLTTILTTINRQQKSVLPQKTFKRCATQPAPTSGDTFDSFACPFDLSTGRRPISLIPPPLLFLFLSSFPRRCPEVELAGWRITCFKTTNHVRTAIVSPLFLSFSLSLALIHRSHNKMPFDFFSFSFSARSYSLSHILSLSLILSQRYLRFRFRLHFTHLAPSYSSHEGRSKGLHEIGFIAISHIIKDKFCFSLRITFSLQCNIKLS